MKKIEKIGRPSMENPESGANIELGQPVLEDKLEKESIEATFPVIEEALSEFYGRRAIHDREAAEIIFMLKATRADNVYSLAVKELKKDNGNATLLLSIIESARSELQLARELTESHELESEDLAKNQKLEIERQKNFEQDMHYQEAADILFNHDEYKVPEKSDFIEWLGETKRLIKKLAKEEEEKFRNAENAEENEDIVNKRVFRSRLLTDIPAIERFETGRETTRDYREIMDVINSRLLSERIQLGSLLLGYANNPKAGYDEMAKTLIGVRQMELFLAMAEGERNERIAKKQP